MLRLFWSISLLCILFIGCNDKKTAKYLDGDLSRIEVDVDSVRNVNSGDLFSEIEYIPLATSDSCLVGSVSRIEFYDSTFFILDLKANSVWAFERNGSFKARIGTEGRGPGEYIRLKGLYVDTLAKKLLMVEQNKYLVYDLHNYHFIEEYRFPNVISSFNYIYLEDDLFALYYPNKDGILQNGKIIVAQKGEVVATHLPKNPNTDCLIFCFPYTRRSDGVVFLVESFNDTIYCMQGKDIQPYARFDFGKYQLPDDVFAGVPEGKKFDKVLKGKYAQQPATFMDNGQYTFFTFLATQSEYMYQYLNLKQRNCRYLFYSIMPDEVGLAYMPEIPVEDICFNDSSFIWSVSLSRFKLLLSKFNENQNNVFLNSAKYKEMVKLSEKSDDDNPILIVHHLRLNP